MDTDNFIINDSGEWEPFEKAIDSVENAITIQRIFSKSVSAFIRETETVVDPSIFMVTSDHMDLIRESDLESHQETDSLQRMGSSVDKVSEEKIVETFDITFLGTNAWRSKEVKESHQIAILTMDITENLDW
jgi:hypothetical protein